MEDFKNELLDLTLLDIAESSIFFKYNKQNKSIVFRKGKNKGKSVIVFGESTNKANSYYLQWIIMKVECIFTRAIAIKARNKTLRQELDNEKD